MARKKSKKRFVNFKKFRLKVFAISAGIIAAITAILWPIHHFGNEKTKDTIEAAIVAIIDIARESPLVPDEAVFILDKIAYQFPFVYGNVVATGTPIPEGEFAVGGIPKSAGTLTILKNKAYVVGYDENLGNPAWVAYKIFKTNSLETAPRVPFVADERSQRIQKVSSQDYANSGFDRGHMAPNQAIGVCYGNEAQNETFLMTNIVPQLHSLNAGVWKNLEQRALKRYAKNFEEIWIVCGPIYSAENRRGNGKKIGKAKVAVPDAFFMILVDEEEKSGALRTLSFVVPHNKNLDSNLSKYLVSIDEIEAATGLDFFSNFEEEVQTKLESAPAKAIW